VPSSITRSATMVTCQPTMLHATGKVPPLQATV
jgi:hypothetical protein